MAARNEMEASEDPIVNRTPMNTVSAGERRGWPTAYFRSHKIQLEGFPSSDSSVRLNVTATLVGNVVFSGSQWLATVLIARLGSIEMVGQYALALAFTTPIF